MFLPKFYFLLFISCFTFLCCKDKTALIDKKDPKVLSNPIAKEESKEAVKSVVIPPKEKITSSPEVEKKSTTSVAKESGSNFHELTSKNGVVVDIKYATKDNFTKNIIYPCGRCYLRSDAALAIETANKILQEKYKYRLKMFDCYRPRPAQQRLWEVVPNPDYVTPPSKGSMHNRGLAVDLTIVDEKGKDLDMGTAYDFFGKEAHTDNLTLPKHVLENRKLLTSLMLDVGFSGIRTEWWHFAYDSKAELSDWEWPCLK